MNIGDPLLTFLTSAAESTTPYPRYSFNPARQVEDKSSLKSNPCLYIIPRIISTFASQFMPTQEGRMEKGHAPRRAALFNLKTY